MYAKSYFVLVYVTSTRYHPLFCDRPHTSSGSWFRLLSTSETLMHQATNPAPPSSNGALRHVLRSPSLLTREALAGVLTALALIPEVISFSVIAGVDPKVSLIASVVLCLAMSVLGGRPAMVTAAAGSVALVIGPMVHQHGVGYILPAVSERFGL